MKFPVRIIGVVDVCHIVWLLFVLDIYIVLHYNSEVCVLVIFNLVNLSHIHVGFQDSNSLYLFIRLVSMLDYDVFTCTCTTR